MVDLHLPNQSSTKRKQDISAVTISITVPPLEFSLASHLHQSLLIAPKVALWGRFRRHGVLLHDCCLFCMCFLYFQNVNMYVDCS